MSSPSGKVPRKGTVSVSAPDLLALLGPDNKNGFLRQKSTSKIIKTVKWRHRFVVLAQNAVYIYENEMSKSPVTSIPLQGYIAVKRETTSTCAWVFALVPGGAPPLKPKIFACSNDVDRKDWMCRIKSNLYLANNVKPTTRPSQHRESKNLTPEEEEYVELDLPIKSPVDTDKDEDIASDSDENEDERDNIVGGRKFPKTPLPLVEESDNDSDSRHIYSAIVEGEECHYYKNDAMTPKAKEWGFEKACTIIDETINRNREKCIEMLKGTNKIGTYLIRKSRTGDYKVLAILTTEDVVKEYRIEEEYGMYHFLMDKNHEFPTIDALLAYYTTYEKVPILNSYLVWGIHECVEGDRMYELLLDD